MTFKNCNDRGFVKVFLNSLPIIAIPDDANPEYVGYGLPHYDDFRKSFGKYKMDANFEVKPGDVLTLKEEDGAIIKVLSLTGRGKNFLFSMNYDQ